MSKFWWVKLFIRAQILEHPVALLCFYGIVRGFPSDEKSPQAEGINRMGRGYPLMRGFCIRMLDTLKMIIKNRRGFEKDYKKS